MREKRWERKGRGRVEREIVGGKKWGRRGKTKEVGEERRGEGKEVERRGEGEVWKKSWEGRGER